MSVEHDSLDDSSDRRRASSASAASSSSAAAVAAAAAAASVAAPSSSPSSSASSLSSLGLSVPDSSVLRINFLRLLHRCEQLSLQHLHPSPGTRPLLQPVVGASGASLYSPDALAFFRGVETLQGELLPALERAGVSIAGDGKSGAKSSAAGSSSSGHNNEEYARRVAFLATLAEKEGGGKLLPPVVVRPRRRPTPAAALAGVKGLVRPLAPGVHSLRSVASATVALGAQHSAALGVDLDPLSLASHAHSHSGAVAPAPDSSSGGGLFGGVDEIDAELDADEDALDEALARATPVDQTQQLRDALFARRDAGGGGGGTIGAASAHGAAGEFGEDAEQRALLADLHEMSGTLKENALRLRTALRDDAAVLDTTDEKLDRNLSAIRRENSRLKRWAAAGCSDMCWNLLLIVTLWAVFIAMFVFIKLFPAPKQ